LEAKSGPWLGIWTGTDTPAEITPEDKVPKNESVSVIVKLRHRVNKMEERRITLTGEHYLMNIIYLLKRLTMILAGCSCMGRVSIASIGRM
jgi:hypothetical protein